MFAIKFLEFQEPFFKKVLGRRRPFSKERYCMDFRKFLKDELVVLDGGMGTLLQGAGLCPGELPERWNLTHPDEVVAIHRAYYDAGSHVVNTNTFGASLLKFSAEELDVVIGAAVANARRAARESTGGQEKFVALDIGPSGRLLRPLGDFDFEDAVALFAETVRLGAVLVVCQKGFCRFRILAFRMQGLYCFQPRVVEVDETEYFRFQFRSLGICREGKCPD